jgi:carboxypeptidase Taq
MKKPPPYHQIENRFRRLSAIGDAIAVLHWDWSAMMPPGGAEGRAGQLAELAAVRHALLTAPEVEELIAAARAEGDLDEWQNANLGEMDRQWSRAAALPEDLVAAMVKAQAACETAWRDAHPKGDFAAVLPSLERVLELVREAAAAQGARLGLDPYDALLDGYEPGARGAEIDTLFADLETFLPDFLGQVLERQKGEPDVIVPEGPFPAERQRALAVRLIEALGFDFDHGRLDESRHPFCGGIPDDVRITTRYDEDDFTKSLMAVLHETGHALYERGLPKAWRGQPVGQALGMSMHEGQSLLIEMQVCRSAQFMAFAAPVMGEVLGRSGPAWEAENLRRLYARVEPAFIRVDADEVTYPAHIMVRYRLEKALVAGELKLADLPAAWNEGIQRLLGLTPPSDREGCLQDLHWYDGAWGYFPTYTLGAMTAAQLFDAAKRADGAIVDGIGRGDFQPLFSWLGANVHSKGARLPAHELLSQATGRPLDAKVFKNHLRTRYLG